MLSVLRPLPVEQIRLVVFDLDGTLIDSRKDLCNAVNAMLAEFHRQPLPEEIIASYIGDGAGMLVRRALGDPHDEPLVDDALQHFLAYYREHKLDHTYVYEGVMESLAKLRALPNGAGSRAMAVLTNKPIGPSLAICAALGLSEHFFRIYGGDSFETKKPDPVGLLALMQEAGAKPEETLMVGDSDVDLLTAQRAGAWSLGCRYGLSPHTIENIPADVLVDTPMEWMDAFAAGE
ncbi:MULTISPECIES: HAD-IA family hydrolase [Acidobacterium]|uniref:phosphoglycolate phosphatase n=1 Tax=Acidobacterium capsulatum (strain ATCC 51196 / DSM 11244 / BCRC 80197 / JCM 7670 / NBRC 15755 / NCIMB 13165 / 161) TaxID=240015 RepID=C1F391_ACIC5|nr:MULTISPECIES: HAD-IA family hydrolase [Acidobacterium]ACO33683.1 putative phosphoglycolate phosphatase [Acidobacterium capsulatum ATCC 51196]HCT60624.1 haloacid dehalogenase [Acidobacterium sp.]